jgi:hypothetical protein
MENLFEIVNREHELTKSRVETMANQIVEIADAGESDLLTLLAKLEFVSQIIETAKSKLREFAVDDLDAYGPEARSGVKRLGVTFKQKETGVKYDYSNTDSWVNLKSLEDSQAEKRKNLEATLKTLKSPMAIVDPNTGEIFDANPPIKSSKTSVEITLPK